MSKVLIPAALAAVALAVAWPAAANDSTATVGAGGLVLTRNADIDMREEDLFVSTLRVRVRYVFRNTAAEPRTVIVAFPMPDRNLAEEAYGDVAYPADFNTAVDRLPVRMDRELRAFVGEREVTDDLRRLGVPLAPNESAEADALKEALAALTAAEQARLTAAGVIEAMEYDAGQGVQREWVPLWTVKETWSWEQTFPAGRDVVVEHSYTPGAGGSVGTLLTMATGDFGAEIAQMRERYCVDEPFMSAARRLARAGGPDSGGLVPERTVRYILTTGGNWRSPIGRFRLVVDKGDPKNLVSFCGEGVRKISPTQFEMVRTDWRPDRDLDVLLLGSAETLYPDPH